MSISKVSVSRLAALMQILLLLVAGSSSGCDGSPRATALEQPEYQRPQIVHQGSGPELMRLGPNGLPGMGLAIVQTIELTGWLETSGQISFDDRRVASIISRVTGRIEEVGVSQWDYVQRGQPILTLYSPDIMTAEAEYLQAKATSSTIAGASPDNSELAHSMIEAAKRKLELLGIEPAQISTLNTAAPSFVMRAPTSGNVVQNQALRGSAVNPGDVLYSLGTLEDVWITGDIYEDDLARVKVGQQLEAVTTAYPDEVFHGMIGRISPNIDPNTHTLQIRCEVRNPGARLKPQMLARVKIVVQPGAALVVPLDALIFDNDSYFAYVQVGADLLERRKVAVGSREKEGYARVLGGLNAGDHVVTNETIQVNALWHQAHGANS